MRQSSNWLINLAIYNLRGQEVAFLINGNMPAGIHRVSWDASNVSSGIYFCRLLANDFIRTRNPEQVRVNHW
ncbi:MAG: T9SS type A sorting domain-containing protein [Candidatus Marinimicrobia bacterium]|nr:T9SS type A sorting domain-containing protein [Candidatus Neomarinimicrobiota bacterium]